MNERALAGWGRLAPLAMAALLVGCPRPDPLPLLDSGAEGDASDVLEVRVDVPTTRIDTGPDVPVIDDRPIDTGSGDADSPEVGSRDVGPDMLLPPTDDGTTVCPVGQTACGGACRNLANDSSHCGSCDHACNLTNATSACQASTCRVVTCFSGYADCDGNPANGCEVNTTTGDVANCGRCGMACPTPPVGATAVCAGSVCGLSMLTCPADRRDCNTLAGDGCETAVQADVNNCGGCGVRCSSTGGTPGCAAGACTIACSAGLGNCDGSAANGCETATTSSTAHCGACGNACPARANATATCAGSTCGIACNAGFGNCDGNAANGCEVDFRTTVTHCGGCGLVCSTNHVARACSGGSCAAGTCEAGFGDCNGNKQTDGCETSTATSTAHCGACGNACPAPANATATCASSSCRPACFSGFGNCDGSDTTGCEIDLSASVTHCGGCGLTCSTNHVTRACSSGSCAAGTCAGGFGDCNGNKQTDGCETDTNSNVSHCGLCGRACPAGNSCNAGVCTPPPCPVGMRLIPAGMFTMGNASFQPMHNVRLSAFCMDDTEVTVAAYRGCASAARCTAPSTVGVCNWAASGREQHPINCVDRAQSQAFCQWRGATLPTEAQWEYAARGTDGRLYPWGSDAPGSQLCWSGNGSRSTTCAVGSFPAGNSPFGLVDMAGNVKEWVSDWDGPYTGNTSSYVQDPTGPATGSYYLHRGGSWFSSAALYVLSVFRQGNNPPSYRETDVGFRCVRPPM